MNMRAAIIVGATGLTGQLLIKQLCDCEEYVSVTAIARRPLEFSHPKLEVLVKDFDELEEADLPPAHDVFCCLGTTKKKAGTKEAFEKVDFEYPMRVASLAKKRGIPHFMVISAMGAKESSPFYYNRVKGKLEKELIDLQLERLSIVRPSLLTGKREEFRMGERLGAFFMAMLKPLLKGPLKKYQSIEAQQLALAMQCIALQPQKRSVQVFESAQLRAMKIIVEEEPEISFDWQRLEQKEDLLDEEITFDRRKLNGDDDGQ